MTHKKSRGDRAAINVIATELGLGRQAAAREFERRKAASAAIDGLIESPKDVEALLKGEPGGALRELIDAFGIKVDRPMDGYTPVNLVEGTIEDQHLRDFVFGTWGDVVDVHVADRSATHLGVHLYVDGAGDVDWFVSVPEGLDADRYGVAEELDNGAPEPISETEQESPVRLQVYVELDPTTLRWNELEVQSIETAPDAMAERSVRHERQDTERQQELGILPPDDVIEQMIAEHERSTPAAPPRGPGAFKRRQ